MHSYLDHYNNLKKYSLDNFVNINHHKDMKSSLEEVSHELERHRIAVFAIIGFLTLFSLLFILLAKDFSRQQSQNKLGNYLNAATAAAAAAPSGIELLGNPGFERSKAWKLPTGGVTITTTTFHSGLRSAQFALSSTAARTIYQDVNASANVQYQASGWINTSLIVSGGAGISLQWLNATGVVYPAPATAILRTDTVATNVIGTNPWAQFTAQLTAPAGAVGARLLLTAAKNSGASGKAWFDDLSFQQMNSTPGPSFVATPLMDLGNQTYLGFGGGLYPNGSNAVPAAGDSAGKMRSSAILPLDGNGVATSGGQIVMLSIGMSNTSYEFCGNSTGCTTTAQAANSFMGQAEANPSVNHVNLKILNGALALQDASKWTSPTLPAYNYVRDSVLTPAGVTEKQVQVVWLRDADAFQTVSLSGGSGADAYTLENEMGQVVRAAKVRYPNLQMVFLSNMTYGGYSTGSLNPEPYAYENGFGIKWLIQAQLDQMANGGTVVDARAGDLNYNTGVAPWVAWGPDLWADGITPRSDGFTWLAEDVRSDGIHPSASGIGKVAGLLMNYFTKSPYTSAWFMATGGVPVK
ncbi:hypothetical protein HY214_04045 [Candidatus Roizmanbacteria bacterium]|nr:hypothetical protein [Candidatus Roizmanbacteria bacterium]